MIPHKDDPLLDERFFLPNIPPVERKIFFKTWVKKVIIESSSYCNRKCHFCPNSLRTEKKVMDSELFSSIIAQLEGVGYDRQVILHLYNEPLAFPEQIVTTIAAVRRSLPESYIYFSTNGDFLNRELMCRLVDAGLSAMTVSVHPGRQFKDTNLLNRFFSLAQRLDVELRFTYYEERVMIMAETVFGHIPIKIRATDFEQRGSNRGGLMGNVTAPSDRQDPCMLPFEVLTIGYDGSVFPCYNMLAGIEAHEQHSITRLTPTSSIFDSFAHTNLCKWRRRTFLTGHKLAPCNSCRLDFVKISNEQNEIRKYFLERLDRVGNICSAEKGNTFQRKTEG